MAESHTLDKSMESLLNYFLESGSLQKSNLRQRDCDFKLPLVCAIESGNIEFIKIVCKSEASLEIKWQNFFDLKYLPLVKALDKFFRPIK